MDAFQLRDEVKTRVQKMLEGRIIVRASSERSFLVGIVAWSDGKRSYRVHENARSQVINAYYCPFSEMEAIFEDLPDRNSIGTFDLLMGIDK